MKSSSGSNNAARAEKSPVKDINDFVPDDDVSGDFLADAEHGGSAQGNDGGKSRATLVSDDEEEDDGNPMVAGFDDEVEIDHFEPVHMEFRARSTLATPTMAISSVSIQMKMIRGDSEKGARIINRRFFAITTLFVMT